MLSEALRLDAEQSKQFISAARVSSVSRKRPIRAFKPRSAATVASSVADAEALLASMPTDAVPPRGALPAGSRMPLAPNPLFVGRGDELLQVARTLQGGVTTIALGQIIASTGLGGLGKTQLAVEFVHRYGRFFAGIRLAPGQVLVDEVRHGVGDDGSKVDGEVERAAQQGVVLEVTRG